jgi:hypothetical protein
MRLMLIALMAIFSPAAASVSEPACHSDDVNRVINDHDNGAPYVIQLRSGRHLRILGEDFIDPRKWRKGEPVAVCPSAQDPKLFDVTNKNRGEKLVTWQDARPSTTPHL